MRLEVFFDYACPYCLRGHDFLSELLPQYPQIEVVWRPCEAHPRPEHYGSHSDLLARGMYFALSRDGADLMEFHRRAYRAALTDRLDIENPRVVAGLLDGFPDADGFLSALRDGAYLPELLENNRDAWETYGFAAVPSYRMNGKTLRSIENIGVNKQQLADFLAQSK